MAPFHDSHGRTFIRHPNGQTTHYIATDFTDPWKPHSTILIQPGFARHANFWHHWIPPLSPHHRIIRRDLRGHGHSSVPSPPYPYTLATILAEIVDTLDQLGLPAVHFLGESTSGMLALALAARHPARLLSVTLCATPTHLPPRAQEMLAFGAESWPAALREFGARGWAERLALLPGTVVAPGSAGEGGGGEGDEGYVEWWKDEIGGQSAEGLAGYAGFLAGLDARGVVDDGEVARGGVPVLVLAPARSAAVSVGEARWLAERVPRARVVVVEGRGHEIYTEKAEECQKAFLEFLEDVEAGRVKAEAAGE
ncbi:hypothetical protein SLS58_005363 [Diplodia intermedia]|uniref:Uncharacterized protein n=1 Tax=Diplodia intermedia TaxID=856260 RepID=A0ABR3TRL5_9PEZI